MSEFMSNKEANERFASSATVLEYTGLSQSLLRYHIKTNRFPEPLKLEGTNCPFWEKTALLEFFRPVTTDDWNDDKRVAIYLRLCRKMGVTTEPNGI